MIRACATIPGGVAAVGANARKSPTGVGIPPTAATGAGTASGLALRAGSGRGDMIPAGADNTRGDAVPEGGDGMAGVTPALFDRGTPSAACAALASADLETAAAPRGDPPAAPTRAGTDAESPGTPAPAVTPRRSAREAEPARVASRELDETSSS